MHKSMLPIELNERVTIKRGGLSMPTFGVFVDGERIGTIRKRAGGSMSEASNRRKKRQFASGGRTVVLARPPGGGTSSIAGNGVGRASRTSPVMHTVPGGDGWTTACGRPVRGLRLPSDEIPQKTLPVVPGDRWTGPYGAERITCCVCISWLEREGWL